MIISSSSSTAESSSTQPPTTYLWIWENVLNDYTSGAMVAIAQTEQEARAIIEAENFVPEEDINAPYTKRIPIHSHTLWSFVIWGGA